MRCAELLLDRRLVVVLHEGRADQNDYRTVRAAMEMARVLHRNQQHEPDEESDAVVSTNVADAPLVPAVFANADAAATAVDRLVQAGINKDDIGVAVPAPQATRTREDSGNDVLAGAALGAAIGGRLGALGGIGLALLTVGTLGVGGLFLAGASGLLWGGTVGGILGIVTRVRRRPDVDQWTELELKNESVLLAVRVRNWSHEPEIAELLKQAGAVEVLDRLERDHTWQELETEHRSGQPAPASS